MTIWQGDDDRMVPCAHGAVAGRPRAAGARAELRPGEGHISIAVAALRRDPGRPAGRVTHWLKALGHARGPLPARWLEDGSLRSLRRTGFPRRPRMAAGDRLVYYASVWQRVFAVVEVVAEPEQVEHPRWPWTIAVEPLLVVPTSTPRPRSRRSACSRAR